MTNENHAIANTILSQLGGNRFALFTGAKNFGFLPSGALRFTIPSNNKLKCNLVTITLDKGTDTYTMTFERTNTRKLTLDTLKIVTDVYNDMLQEVFTMHTGLYTKF